MHSGCFDEAHFIRPPAKNVILKFVFTLLAQPFVFQSVRLAGYHHGIGIHEAALPPFDASLAITTFVLLSLRMQEASSNCKNRTSRAAIPCGAASAAFSTLIGAGPQIARSAGRLHGRRYRQLVWRSISRAAGSGWRNLRYGNTGGRTPGDAFQHMAENN